MPFPSYPGSLSDVSHTSLSLHMLMGEQMILAIFIIAVAFGAETEFQTGIVLIGPAADGALMLCDLIGLMHLGLKLLPADHLLRSHMPHPGPKPEDDEIQKGRYNSGPIKDIHHGIARRRDHID